jgi:hypothetical protein
LSRLNTTVFDLAKRLLSEMPETKNKEFYMVNATVVVGRASGRGCGNFRGNSKAVQLKNGDSFATPTVQTSESREQRLFLAFVARFF